MGDGHADSERALRDAGAELGAGVVAATAAWVERCVRRIALAHGTHYDPGLAAATTAAGRRATVEVECGMRAVLDPSDDAAATSPLEVLRGAVRHPTVVLEEAGVPAVVRDEFTARAFPDDVYGLVPANLAEVDESLAEPGLRWGAAKAALHLARHRGD